MIKRLYVDNYKCLVNFDLKLDELSLLLGPNGVGKSSVLDVMFALRQLLGGVAKVTDPEVFPNRSLTRWQTGNVQVVELDVSLADDELTYRLEIEHDPQTKLSRITREELSAGAKPLFLFILGNVLLYRDDNPDRPIVYKADLTESALARVPSHGEQHLLLSAFLTFIRKIVICSLHPRSFKAESSQRDSVLLRDASNFASWYQQVILERQDLLPEFTLELQKVLHGFKAINLPRVGQDTVAMRVLFEEGERRYELRLDEISDGQRALIALYALVYLGAGQGYSLFLDEPDNFVALAEIQPWLIALKDACGETVPQAVLCSHHPELIDYLGPECGISLQRETSGVIVPSRLRAPSEEAGLRLSELVARGWES